MTDKYTKQLRRVFAVLLTLTLLTFTPLTVNAEDSSPSECYMDETFVKKEEEIRQAIQLRTDILKTKEKILVSYHEDFLERKG